MRARTLMFFATGCLGSIAFAAGPTALAEAANQAPAADRESTTLLDALRITARRREEEAQEVPVSLTVQRQEDLAVEHVHTLDEVAATSPSTLFNPDNSTFTIRGVGAIHEAGVDLNPGVGVFLDQVFIGRPNGVPAWLGDLERVEVVRGSQATLYGKNTIGGAVNLVPRSPGVDPALQAESTAGSHGFRRLGLGGDLPVLDGALMTRGHFAYERRDGYIRNRFDGEELHDIKRYGGRFTVMGFPSLTSSVKLSLDFERDDGDGAGLAWAPLEMAKRHRADLNTPLERDISRYGASVHYDHEASAFSLSSITAYRTYEFEQHGDGDFSSITGDDCTPASCLGTGQIERQWQFSQEVRLSSTSIDAPPAPGLFSWMGGVFYMHEYFDGTQLFDTTLVPSGRFSRNYLEQDTDTYAIYGMANYHLTRALQVTGGLRYSYELKSGVAGVDSRSGTNFLGPPAEVAYRESYRNLSPELGLNYTAAPGMLGYFRVARGFKSGGVSQFMMPDGGPNRYRSEKAWTYEGGIKSSWWENRLLWNTAVFYVDWEDMQQRVFVDPFTRVVGNAASATTSGIETSLSLRPTDTLNLSASYGYLHTRFDDFVVDELNEDFSGQRLPYAPRHTATLQAEHHLGLGGPHTLVSSLLYRWTSPYTFSPDGSHEQPSAHRINASVGVLGNGWGVTAWGKNLLDEEALEGYYRYGDGAEFAIAEIGRTYGLTLRIDL